MSAANVTNVVDHLVAGGIKSGVALWVANWNLTEQQAIQEVLEASGPFPIEGVQYGSGTWGDFDVWAEAWLARTSGAPVASNPVSNLKVIDRGWSHLEVNWDNQTHATSYSVKAYWPANKGNLVWQTTVPSSPCRVRNLLGDHTYEIRVRAHPARSVGADASVNGTTR
jgi:hypothetical protein